MTGDWRLGTSGIGNRESGIGTRCPLPVARCPFQAQSHRAPDDRAVAHDHQRDVVFFREPRQADRDLAGERGRAVEHHEAERAAPQQDVGAPGALVGAVRPDHPETTAVAGFSPLARGQCARSVDDGDPSPGFDGGLHQVPDECRPSTAARALDLRQSPARHPAVRQRAIQRRDPGRDRDAVAGTRGWQDCRQLLAERRKGHGGQKSEARSRR